MNLVLDSLPSILTVMNTAVLSHLARPLLLDPVPEGQEPGVGAGQWWRDPLANLSLSGKENEI